MASIKIGTEQDLCKLICGGSSGGNLSVHLCGAGLTGAVGGMVGLLDEWASQLL